jgi:hypothetical protein
MLAIVKPIMRENKTVNDNDLLELYIRERNRVKTIKAYGISRQRTDRIETKSLRPTRPTLPTLNTQIMALIVSYVESLLF